MQFPMAVTIGTCLLLMGENKWVKHLCPLKGALEYVRWTIFYCPVKLNNNILFVKILYINFVLIRNFTPSSLLDFFLPLQEKCNLCFPPIWN